jgi:O-succinylbenzoic acid--CoA ligase
MTNTEIEIHPDFKINGHYFETNHLKKLAYTLIKEGEEHEEVIGNFMLDWLNPNYQSIKLRTSGSTGEPKVIYVDRDKMINSAKATGKHFKLANNTTALSCIPTEHIAGKMMMIRAMVLGWNLHIIKPSSTPLEHVYKTYDFCAMTPFQLDHSLSRLHLVKKIIVGGAPVSQKLIDAIQDKPAKIYETYGMTETLSHVATRRLNPKKKKAEGVKPFKALPNVSFTTTDDDCLIIKAPKILDEHLETTDIVDLLTFKKFYWKGRKDNVINSGGIKIHPEEVEKKLQGITSIRFFISSIPDDALGQKLVLIVESGYSAELEKELSDKINKLDNLSKYEKPKKIYMIEKFEETDSGKIKRQGTIAQVD